jgi:hypothetical protein
MIVRSLPGPCILSRYLDSSHRTLDFEALFLRERSETTATTRELDPDTDTADTPREPRWREFPPKKNLLPLLLPEPWYLYLSSHSTANTPSVPNQEINPPIRDLQNSSLNSPPFILDHSIFYII